MYFIVKNRWVIAYLLTDSVRIRLQDNSNNDSINNISNEFINSNSTVIVDFYVYFKKQNCGYGKVWLT